MANAQSRTQMGMGNGGQVRAVYFRESTPANTGTLYIGSDVAGVWRSNDFNITTPLGTPKLHYDYISNHEIMRFMNKFVLPPFTTRYLLACDSGGIHLIDMDDQTVPMKKIFRINFGANEPQHLWVSDVFIGSKEISQVGTLYTYPMYFTTGNTRGMSSWKCNVCQLSLSATITNVACNGGTSGSIVATGSCGAGAFTYAINGGAFQSSNTFNNLAAGTYTVTVKDGNGATVAANFTVTEPAPITIQSNYGADPCIGAATGSIDITPSGGVPGDGSNGHPMYTYIWSGGTTSVNTDGSTGTSSALTAGNYDVTVTDATGCSKTFTLTVTANEACCGAGATDINDQSDFDGLAGSAFQLTYNLNASIVINSNVTFDGATFYVAEGVSIIVSNGVTLTITATQLLSCGNMWRGIIVEDGGTLIIDGNTIIRDAQFGVEVLANGNLDCRSATFDHNYVDISIPDDLQNGIVTIYGTTFECLNCLSGNPLKQGYPGQSPMPNQITFAGIDANNATFAIGVAGQAENHFKNLYRGVSLTSCYTTILNSDFAKIQNGAYYIDHGGYAIYADMQNKGSLRQIGLGKTNPLFTFDDCYTGIYAVHGGVDISQNNMNAMYRGIRSDNPDFSTVRIYDNEIAATWQGILSNMGDYAHSISIHHNGITVTDNFGAGIAIYEKNARKASNPCNINCNTIRANNGARGIMLNAVDYAGLRENAVTLDNGSNSANGIALEGSRYCSVIMNNAGSTAINKQTAFYIKQSPGCGFVNNASNNTAIGFDFLNGCANDEAFKGNVIGNHNIGLHLNGSGIMGIQTHRGNKWNGAYGAWGAQNDNNNAIDVLFNRFRVHEPLQGTVYHPNNNVPNVAAQWFIHQPSLTWFSEIYPNLCLIATEPTDDGNAQARLSYTDTLIVYDSINAVEFETELKQITKRDLQDKFNENDSLQTSNSFFETFYTQNNFTPLGELSSIHEATKADEISNVNLISTDSLIFVKMDSLILIDSIIVADFTLPIFYLKQNLISTLNTLISQSGSYKYNLKLALQTKFYTAKVNNAVIATTNEIEQYEQEMNDFHFSYADSRLMEIPISRIETVQYIASLCPFAYGKAVYTARSELARLNMDTIQYDDKANCAALGYMRLLQNLSATHKKEVCEVYAYPNPTKGVVYLKFGRLGIGNATVVVRDAMGKVILLHENAFTDGEIKVNLETLCNGLYFLTLENDVLKSRELKIAVIK